MKVYIKKKAEISFKETTINNGLAKLPKAENNIAKKSQEMQVQVVEIESKKKQIPLGWVTMISYIASNAYESFFYTIKEWQEKLERK